MSKASDDTIGSRIKSRRKMIGMSLRELASHTGFTPSFLSQVERGQTNPSIRSLREISTALGVPILHFLYDGLQYTPYIRKDQRSSLTLPGSDMVFDLLMPDLNRKMGAFLGHLQDGKKKITRTFRVHTEEFLFVLSGALTIELDQVEYTLESGDSIYYDGIQLNSISCAMPSSNGEASFILVVTPPVF